MFTFFVVGLCALVKQSSALDLPARYWCSNSVTSTRNTTIPWEDCAKVGGTERMMEEISNIEVQMPHWWESLKPYKRKCPSCTPIWLLCPVEDTGAWDGGSALRLGSRIMLELINEQQWLLPGYELMCEYYNNDCVGAIAQKIVSGRSSLNHDKYVGVGGTGCSGVSNILSQYTWTYNMPIMSWASGAPDLSVRSKHRNFFRTVIPHTAFTYAWISVYIMCGWTKIVVILAEEARFRGHFNMHNEEIKKAGLETVFDAQILDPLVQTDGIVKSIKDKRYRIVQVVTFENTWRAMMCSAYSMGMRGIVWLVFGVYSKGWYNTLDNPLLTQWNCGTEELRMMGDYAIWAQTVMWSKHMDTPLYCDEKRNMTAAIFKELVTGLSFEELQGGGAETSDVVLRGGHSPKSGYFPAPADGVCLYAQTLSAMLGLHPEGKKANNGKSYTLQELTARSDEVYDQINGLFQTTTFAGVGSSSLAFYCEGLPSDGSHCDDKCRNAPDCTGDLGGPSEIFQFDKDGERGKFDSYVDNSEFPIRFVFDRTVEMAATDEAGRAKAYEWWSPLRFSNGMYWHNDDFVSSSWYSDDLSSSRVCKIGYHKAKGTEYCVPDDQLPDCQPGQVLMGEFCSVCAVNQMWEEFEGQKVCRQCPTGRMQPLEGQISCDPCAVGRYSNQTTEVCVDCSLGSYAASLGASACSPCAPGMYTAKNASEKCKSCGIGTYSSSDGSRECQRCPAGLTTQFPGASTPVQCICPEGTTFNFNSDTCEACPDGMVCEVGSNLSFLPGYGEGGECPDGLVCTYPKVARGYMSMAKNPLGIYLCLVKEQCPGGEPGTCAAYRDATEVACGRCAEGSYENGDECEPCEGGGQWILLMLLIVLFIVVLIGMTFTVNKDISMQNNSTSLVLIIAGQLCTMVQTMGLFLNINIDWFGPLKDIFWIFSILSFNLDFLKLNCTFRVNSFSNYLCRQLVAPAGVFWVALTLVFKRSILRKATHLIEEFTNTIGVLFSMFFISIVISAVTPFICYRHPGDSGTSLTTSPSILCFDSDAHSAMLSIGIVAFILVVVPFVVLAVYGTVSYPKMIANSTDRNSMKLAMFRFLFFRFKGVTYYYGCMFLIRNLCICFVPVVIRENAALQVLVMSLLLLGFCMVQLMIQPWRMGVANVCDGVIVNGMVLLLMFASVFNNFEHKNDSSLEVLGTVLFGVTVAVSIATIAWGISDRLVPRPFYNWFICHHKAGAAAQARYVKILFQQAIATAKVFIDSDDLIDLETLFDTVKCKTAHVVVYLTTEILSRPWCAGEIVMTHKGNQKTVNTSLFGKLCGRKRPTGITCIRTVGFKFPSAQQLDHLDDYIDNTSMSLVAHNITTDDVKRAYTWLQQTPTVDLDAGSVGRQRLSNAIGQIMKKSHKSATLTATRWDDIVVISTDPDDEEATSTAAILLHYIERDVTNVTQRPPSMFIETARSDILTYVEAISKCRAVVMVLTHGTLQCPTQLEMIVTAIKYSNEGRQHGIIPVHTPAFTFPSSAFYEKELLKMQMSDDFYTYFTDYDIPVALKEFFNKISMYLATTSSERVLRAQSHDVFMRIPRNHVAASKELEADGWCRMQNEWREHRL